MRPEPRLIFAFLIALSLGWSPLAKSGDDAAGVKLYRLVDGEVDERTYNGFRRYHAGCNHCHGPDGMGSTFGPSLIERLPDAATFRQVVRLGAGKPPSMMNGFAGDPNIAPYIDDIYAYLQARADGVLPRGRPARQKRRSHPSDRHRRGVPRMPPRDSSGRSCAGSVCVN